MHRIDTKTAEKDKFGAGKNGFTRGNPQTGTPATDLDDDYFDMLQEELCSVVEASGASLEKGRHDQLLTALRALLLSRKNPFGDIKSDGTVKTALENLGLGEAATRNVGTDTGQVPDMSSFTTGYSGAANWPNSKSGWSKGPDGVITQWGVFGFPVGQTGTNVVFPLPFPARVESITLTMADIQESLLSPTTMPA
ncbi:gp53-like domain-containing protein, partial [Escherichia coli]|uniref:gp53-like domain-containing protein n=1 Tax=Escherichia coli TaxID=562 RepID=UPI000A188727